MTIPAPISKLTLVRAPQAPARDGMVVRRYRLARLEVNGARDSRHPHEHLRRVYD